jgi:tetratricopeptide (TPR) repeat protein
MAEVLESAVHHSIVLADVEGFGARRRTRADQGAIRHGLYQALALAFSRSRIGWDDCYREDRGDGVLILVPAQAPKAVLAAGVPGELAAAIRAHNRGHGPDARMRLRLALHAGEVLHDAHGVTGGAVNLAFRLLEAGPLKQALATSPGVLAVVCSAWFYEEVIRHAEGCAPATWRRVAVTVKETREDGWISLPDAPYPARLDAALPALPAAAEVRYSLPPDAAGFTGRDEELARVTATLADAAGAGGVIAVRAIGGMPGAGKTALAVHAAHLLRYRFPDRQLFLDLHGHTPGREPVRPEDALAGLLTAAGVDTRFLPDDLDGRAAMWRDKMAGQRALLVLDNAASTRQVAPLLPGEEGCLVLVTSRRHLGDLPGAVIPVLLDVLPPEQAGEMFTRLAPRAAGSPGEVAEVVELAGFLPLAISLLARVFARHRSWTLADLAAETRARLLTLSAENDSVAAAFEVSYRHLDPARQRLFCLLGLHPGTTIEAYAAAALTGTGLAEAAGLLDALHGEGLLTETGHRRYGMHDLLRRYARDHAAGHPGSPQAVERLLDYYQHTAARADALINFHTRPGPPPAAPAGRPAAPDLQDEDQALAWARAERASLLACLDHATRAGQHARVIALTAGLAGLWRRDGPFADAVTRYTAADQAASHLGDRLGRANALTNLGAMRWRWAEYRGAAQALQQALGIYHDLGDRLGQANTLTYLGATRRSTGEYLGGSQALEQALDIYRDLGDRFGQANALYYLGRSPWTTNDYQGAAQVLEQALGIYRDLSYRIGQASALCYLGAARRRTEDYPGAAQALEQGLRMFRDLGIRAGEAAALNERGTLDRVRGEVTQAEECHQQALELARAISSSWDEARALVGLGRCALASGHAVQAEVLQRQALEIFQRIGAAEARDLLAELDALTSQDPQDKP